MKKRILAIALTLCMSVACITPAFAAEGVKNTKVFVNGVAMENVYADCAEGTAASIPVRAVCEALGCTVEWIPNGDPSVIVYDMAGRKVMSYNVGDDFVTKHKLDSSTEEIALMAPVYTNPGWVSMINGYAIANVLGIPVYVEGESDPLLINTMFHYDGEGNVCFPNPAASVIF